jgi:hypothetical protein
VSKIRIGDKNKFSGPTAIGDHASARGATPERWAGRHPWITGTIFCILGAVLGVLIGIWPSL